LNTSKHIFITGGCGFIGSHFVRLALDRWPNAVVTNFDLLTYAGNPENLTDCENHPRYRFIKGDIRDGRAVLEAMDDGVDVVVHFAAESHVDRSIISSNEFFTTNVMGTNVLMKITQELKVKKFVFIGTDEVYGSLSEPQTATEDSPLVPNNPYSVSKAAADMLVRSYIITYGFPAVITRACNNFGPNQYPEKLVSLFITNLLEDKKVPLYGDGLNVRDWIYVADNCEAIARVLEDGRTGEIYNIGGSNPHTNCEITNELLAALGMHESYIEHVQDRPGHDRRYAMDSSKIERELGWKPKVQFKQALAETIEWYRDNPHWWGPIKSGTYREYYETQYGL